MGFVLKRKYSSLAMGIMLLVQMFLCAQIANSKNNNQITFLMLDGTVEPLLITEPGKPMAGGIITDLAKLIFENSNYEIQPKLLPWKRLAAALRDEENWFTYGFPGGFGSDIPHEFSSTAVLSFNHVAITLRRNDFDIHSIENVFGRTAILVENFHYPGLDPYLDTPIVGRGSGEINSIRAFKPVGALRMLRHQRGDVVFGYQGRMLYNIANSGLTLADVRFQDASNIIPTNPVYFAFSPKMPASVKKLINTRLELLSKNGRLTEIVTKYSGPADLLQ